MKFVPAGPLIRDMIENDIELQKEIFYQKAKKGLNLNNDSDALRNFVFSYIKDTLNNNDKNCEISECIEEWKFIRRMGVEPTYQNFKAIDKAFQKAQMKKSSPSYYNDDKDKVVGISFPNSSNKVKKGLKESIMTDKLQEYLKTNNGMDLISQGAFYKLFEDAPQGIRLELFNMLKDSDIQITDEHGSKYYKIIQQNAKTTLQIKGKNKHGGYDLEFASTSRLVEEQIIMLKDFETALFYSINEYYNAMPKELDEEIVNSYEWVNIEDDLYTTQDGIDTFDPTKIKDRRIKAAAREEFDNELSRRVTKRLIKSKDQLKQELKPYYNGKDVEDPSINIYINKINIRINFEHDPSKQDEIIKVIENNLTSQAKIRVNKDNQFVIVPTGKKVVEIKNMIEDEFGVTLS